jgi:ribonucleoside-diphosphate reductase alpha chain
MSLPTIYQQFIHLSRYARWLDKEERRESWEETVKRYFDFFEKHLEGKPNVKRDRKILEQAVVEQKIMPSMRSLMTAGDALLRDNVAGYNCAYLAVNRPRAFDECLFILMCGTGVGFSVERREVEKLPEVPEELFDTDTTIVVADSKIGWAKAYKELIHMLYSGQIPKWDTSKIRKAGTRLKTFGGRSSGPLPLDNLFRFTVETFKSAVGRKLSSIECHDLMCKIAEIVVVGGVRRSALISLSNLTDERMRKAKSGQWWLDNTQRALSNNSVVYTEKPDVNIFLKEWMNLIESKSGERGIFNRVAAKKQVEKLGDRRDPNYSFGTNPCSEIILRDAEFCNLTEVVVRPEDTPATLAEKVELASILGTWQATLTHFRYLSKTWKKNCEEEALLGVSLTGIMDNAYTNGTKETKDFSLASTLTHLKGIAIETNKKVAKQLGINPAAAITCVKPSGTVSQLVDAASGIHARHAPYYIRTVRGDKKDPICQFMVKKGIPHESDVTKPDHTWVFSFPLKTTKSAICRNDKTALEQLEFWKLYQEYWCEHKPSVTITVREYEWIEVGAWVFKNFDMISGISFLPHIDHSYQQAPYQDCTEAEYKEMLKQMPEEIDWDELSKYEHEDHTRGSQEYACTGDKCEIVDIQSEN